MKFVNKTTKVTITCPKHGDFLIQPNTFLNSVYGCGKCRYPDKEVISKPSKEQQLSIKQQVFINRAKEIHGDRYNYSKVVYSKACEKVIIICPIHGSFECTPHNHLVDCGCPRCSDSKGELIVATWLKNNNIAYTQEKSLKIDNL